MKKTINTLKFAAILLLLAGVISSCGKNNEPTEIPFTEYTWGNTDCYWTDLGSDNSVIIINSETELEKYLICAESNCPEIDFPKHTLLMASGPGAFSVESVTFFQNSKDEYELKVTIKEAYIPFDMENRVYTWHIAIVVPKIPDVAKINLKVDVIELY
jgi:hypothetical protein